MIPEILATLACGIFAGAAIYVNAGRTARAAFLRDRFSDCRVEAELPARGSDAGVAGAGGSVLAFFSAWLSRDSAWIVGGALLFAVGPFTLLVIFPTNKKLQSAELDVTSERSGASSAVVGPTACGAQRAELAGVRGFPLRVEIQAEAKACVARRRRPCYHFNSPDGAMVQRLARGPFKAEIRVRFPLALPNLRVIFSLPFRSCV